MPNEILTKLKGQTSDHLPREVAVDFGDDFSVKVATWNMLNMCHDDNKGTTYSNNPFNQKETLEEYTERFTQQLEQLKTMMKGNDVILLQEVDFFFGPRQPKALKGKLDKDGELITGTEITKEEEEQLLQPFQEKQQAFTKLKTSFEESLGEKKWKVTKSSNSTKRMLTLYNSEKLELKEEANQQKKVLPSPQTTTDGTKKTDDNGNVIHDYSGQRVEFTDIKNKDQELVVVNMHLSYEYQEYDTDITKLANQETQAGKHVIMGGDTNHSDLKTVLYGPNSSVDSKSKDGKDGKNIEASSLDGFVVRSAKNKKVTVTMQDGLEFGVEEDRETLTVKESNLTQPYKAPSKKTVTNTHLPKTASKNKKTKNSEPVIPITHSGSDLEDNQRQEVSQKIKQRERVKGALKSSESEVFKDVGLNYKEKLNRHYKIEYEEDVKNFDKTVALIRNEIKKKDEVFSNKLIRAVNKLRDKSDDTEKTWKDLTTLDKKVLTEFYNINHPDASKIDFKSLFHDNNQYGEIKEEEKDKLKDIIDYSSRFIPENSITSSSVTRLAGTHDKSR